MLRSTFLSLLTALAALCIASPAAADRPDFQLERPRLERSVRQSPSLDYAPLPDEMPYDSGPVPPGYHYEERPRTAQLWGGGLTFLSAWATDAALVIGVALCTDSAEDIRNDTQHCAHVNKSDAALYLTPVVGPTVAGAMVLAHGGLDDDGRRAFAWFSFATGAAQLFGASLWLYATHAGPERVVVRHGVAASPPPTVVVPVAFGSHGLGLSMAGTF